MQEHSQNLVDALMEYITEETSAPNEVVQHNYLENAEDGETPLINHNPPCNNIRETLLDGVNIIVTMGDSDDDEEEACDE